MLPKLFSEFDRLWNDGPFSWSSTSMWIPEGYKLVEDPDHKKKRLEQNVEGLEKLIEFYQKKLDEAKKELKSAS